MTKPGAIRDWQLHKGQLYGLLQEAERVARSRWDPCWHRGLAVQRGFWSKRKPKPPILPFKPNGPGLPFQQHREGASPAQLCLVAGLEKQRHCQGLGKQTPTSCMNTAALMQFGRVGFPRRPSFSHTLTPCPLSGRFSKGEASCRQGTGVRLWLLLQEETSDNHLKLSQTKGVFLSFPFFIFFFSQTVYLSLALVLFCVSS